MPVVVTDAMDPIGEAVVRLLAGRAEVRTFAHGRVAASLRAAGAKVTERGLDDPDAIRSALNDAHTIVHTADALFEPQREIEPKNLGSTRRLVAAARRADVRRFLFVSSVGADPGSPNPYLASKGEAEELVRGEAPDPAVIRVTVVSERLPHVFGRWLWWRLVPGDGRQRFAAIAAADAARILVAADDRAGTVEGTFAASGSDICTADDLARSELPRLPLLRARPGTRMAARLPLSPPAAEVLAGDRLPDAPDAAATFHLEPADD